jgi:YD repeat-containing protein
MCKRDGWILKSVTTLLLPALIIGSAPVHLLANPPQAHVPGPPPSVAVERGSPANAHGIKKTQLAEDASDAEIFRFAELPEPLVPVGAASPDGNTPLVEALRGFQSRTRNHDLTALEAALTHESLSRWKLSLLLNLGILSYETGQFSKAIAYWQQAWDLGKDDPAPAAKVLADRAVGELALMKSRIGRYADVIQLINEVEGRNLGDVAALRMDAAREGADHMKNRTGTAFRCGPYAVEQILISQQGTLPSVQDQQSMVSPWEGFSLTQVHAYATRVGLNLQMAKREPGAAVITPSVAHWKLDHFGAILKQTSAGLYLKDPTFGRAVWLSPEVLDQESSGYFLVPAGPLPAGWTPVDSTEGDTVFGKGATNNGDQNATSQNDKQIKGDPPCPGMAAYNAHAMLVSLSISDIPVGYDPPVGPSVRFTVRYIQRANEVSGFNFTHFGPRWVSNWVSYLEDDPLAPADVLVHLRGGGAELYTDFDYHTGGYSPASKSRTRLHRTSNNSYERVHPDGSKEIYSHYIGTTGTNRKVFLSQVVDPYGNTATLEYDTTYPTRLKKIYDAIGQVTTLTYGDGSDAYLVTKVEDPFGSPKRNAQFAYTTIGGKKRLTKITDVIGIESQFEYDSSGAIIALTTPYGTTRFSYGFTQIGEGVHGLVRWLEISDPYGDKERLEYTTAALPLPNETLPAGLPGAEAGLGDRNTLYWDKKAMRLGAGDPAKAQIWHWALDGTMASGILESEKAPLEGRIWYTYPGQPQITHVGTSSTPNRVARVLNDGSTQLYQHDVDPFGNVTKSVDPLGRTFSYAYAVNGIDLLEVRQTRGVNDDLLVKANYNNRNQPLTITDASGRTTTYTYNGRGQVSTVTNAKNEVVTFTYDSDGYLTEVDGPQTGTQDKIAITYDGYGRPYTVAIHAGPAGSDVYTRAFEYDALDRLTKITYPDSTFEQVFYGRLDAEKFRDRMGRWTTRTYNALRQVVSERDPLGRMIKYEWCKCGALQELTDALGRVTKWTYDVQGRLTKKTYPDASEILYTYETKTSRLASTTDARGTVTSFAYYLDNALAQVAYAPGTGVPDSPTVDYEYDDDYRRVTEITSSLGEVSYSYYPYVNDFFGDASNGRGRVESIDGIWNDDTITYTYDELGRVLKRSINGAANEEEYTYDASGRISTVDNNLGLFDYTYLNPTYVSSRIAQVEYPNGQVVNYDWDTNTGDFRLKQIENLSSTSAVLSKFNYTYNAVGNITQWKQQVGASAADRYDLGYDAADQLTAAVLKTDSTNAILKQYYYGYDKAGNRTSEQIDTAIRGAAFNNLNQLTSGTAPVRFNGTLDEPGTVAINGTEATMTSPQTFETNIALTSGTHTVPVAAKDENDDTRTQNYEVVVPGGATRTPTYDADGNMTDNGDG